MLLLGWAMPVAAQPAAATDTPAEASASAAIQVDFDALSPGPFQSLSTPGGTFSTINGQAVIDDAHAKSGRHCLQLTGGEQTVVEWELPTVIDQPSKLSFWAERWTRAEPFSFRIEALLDGRWQEFYNGDDQIRVGRAFLSQVQVPLPVGRFQRLRLRVSSPPNTGILLDDLRMKPASPQRLVGATVVPQTLPVLVGRAANPLLKLRIQTDGSLEPLSLQQLQVTLPETTDVADIAALHCFVGGADENFAAARRVAEINAAELHRLQTRSEPLVIRLTESAGHLVDGVNYVWISCQLKDSASIDHQVGVACHALRFSDGSRMPLKPHSIVQRMGVALRSAGEDAVHTYRIPGLATTNDGSLIAVYDARRRSGGDLPGDIDIGMSRSTDGGQSWQPMRIITDMGDDPQWRYDGVGDPAVLVDRNTGTIWVAGLWSHGNRGWHGSAPGLQPEQTGQVVLVRSDDDGLTWSAPINITSQIKRPEWSLLLQGPGKGITMRDGTLVFAAQYRDAPAGARTPRSTILFSKDHGKTWQTGTGAFDNTTEAQVVEIEPGVLMLNARYDLQSRRVVMVTRDLGKTWQPHATSLQALIEPRACMASLINVGQETGDLSKAWLLFSNPDSDRRRESITIKASPDLGQTWPAEHHRLLDEGLGFGYSCLTMIDDQTVGILYEGSQAQMTFQRLPLRQLTQSDEPTKAKN